MKRLHIHINTSEAEFTKSVEFYRVLFAAPPSKTRRNYAKWMLEEPCLNFVLEVLENASDAAGIHHIGVQVDGKEELDDIRDALKTAELPLLEVGETTCCFSKSEKNWTMDPNGVRWETFRSFGDVAEYGSKTEAELANYNVVSAGD